MRISKVFLSIVAITSAAVPACGSSLIPLTDRDDLYGWEAVGRLNIGQGGSCTGVLIASDLVLTAAHCVYNPADLKPIEAKQFVFSAGLRNGVSIEQRTGSMVVAHGAYDPSLGVTPQNIRHDVALIKLSAPISTLKAAPFAIHSGIAPGNSVSVVSYGQGRNDVLSWEKKCDVLGRGRGLIAFNCNVTHGSSGAPVFVKEGNRARIVSLVSSGRNANGETVAFGMELPENIANLKQALRVGGKSPLQLPQIKRVSVTSNRGTTGAKFIKN